MYKYHCVHDCPSDNIEYQSFGTFCSSPHNQQSLSPLAANVIEGRHAETTSRSTTDTICDSETTTNDGLGDDDIICLLVGDGGLFISMCVWGCVCVGSE